MAAKTVGTDVGFSSPPRRVQIWGRRLLGPLHTLDDFIDMVHRRARLIARVIAAGCLISVLYALSQHHIYSSTEVIQVAQPQTAGDFAPPMAVGSSVGHLQLIQQKVSTWNNMLEIIDGFGLYAEDPDLKPGEMVDRLRRSVRFDEIVGDGTTSILSITAEMPTARQAQLVAHELARRAIDIGTTLRIDQARETLDFFTAQEDRLTADIAALQKQINSFHAARDVSLPDRAVFRRDEIASINQALLDVDRQSTLIRNEVEQVHHTQTAATVNSKLAGFDAQLAALDAQRHVLQSRKTKLEQPIEATPDSLRELADFERQLQRLQGELAVISTRRAEAVVGFRLQTEWQGKRFTVIEHAALPDAPVTGSRKQPAMLGGMLSVMLALALALVLERRMPVIRTARQMEREVGVVPVVSIPFLDARPIKASRWQRLRAWFGWSTESRNSAV